MSYILDALKKSEQERGHGNIPDVQTVHSSSLSYRNEKKAYWPYILIAAVLLNLVAIVYFIVDKENPKETADTTQATTVASHTTVETKPAAKEITAEETPVAPSSNHENKTVAETMPEPEEKTIETKTRPAKKTETAVTAQEEPTTNEPTEIIDFYELPEAIKQELPSIVISAHVYSSNPLQRSIVINNNFMEEGEYVLDGLILYEITPDGAIFDYKGTLFSYGVVSGWQ